MRVYWIEVETSSDSNKAGVGVNNIMTGDAARAARSAEFLNGPRILNLKMEKGAARQPQLDAPRHLITSPHRVKPSMTAVAMHTA